MSDADKDLDLHIDDSTQTLEYLQFEFKWNVHKSSFNYSFVSDFWLELTVAL